MEKIKFNDRQLRKMEGAGHRKALIEEGLYSKPTHKVHKSKKAYSRKGRSRKGFDNE